MKLSIKAGSTSQTVNVFIQDSSSTTGAGKTGLAFNSSGLTAYYALPKAASVAITLATLAAVTSSYSSGGFKEIDSTNMPGWYRFDVPDAAIASGRFVSIHLQGVTNMAPLPIEIELTGWDNQDAVRGGMTALPNANAEAAGGLYTRGSGAGQISQTNNGQVDTNAARLGGTTCTGRDIGLSVLLSPGTGTGQLDFTAGVIKANATQWLGGTIPAVNVTGVPLVDLKYTLGTVSPATAGSVRADSVTGAVGSVTGAVGSVTAAVTVGTNNDKTGYALTAGEHTSIASDAQTGLTAQGYTTTRAGYLDTLNGLVAAVWAAGSRTLTAFGFSVGVTGDLSATMKTSVEAAVWDATAASHNTAGTTGAKLNSAASAGDPWATALPGAYAAGTAGAILGALNGAIAAIWAYGTRTLSAFGFTVNVNSNSDVTAIKAKTDQLAFTVANRVDATVTSGNPNTYQQQGSGDSPFIGR